MLFGVIVLTLMRDEGARDFSSVAGNRDCHGGLRKILGGLLCLSAKSWDFRPGFVVDLNALKPWNGGLEHVQAA